MCYQSYTQGIIVLIRSWKTKGFLILLVVWAYSCASVSAPEGGPKDEEPPEVVLEKSSPNLQTNFLKQDIFLSFNEWVQLKDEFRQVVISPPLENRPEIKLKGKKLILSFADEEVLKSDVTYTINFGEAVQDLTEGNPAKDLRFVFSTGAIIDSLTLNGSIQDAFTGEPVEDVLFMLYDSFEDSIVYQERPYYFGRTDKEGKFQIPNLRAGNFKGFALKDGNLNYLYDQANEQIGFLQAPITIEDSTQVLVEVSLFSERPPILLTRVDTTRYGRLKLVFNQSPEEVQLNRGSTLTPIYREQEKDTLTLWYDQSTPTEQAIFLGISDTLNFDTLRFNLPSRDTFIAKRSLRLTSPKFRKINPFKAIRLQFNHPIASVDTSLLILERDSIQIQPKPVVFLDSVDQRELIIRYGWKEDSTYSLILLPGFTTDQFGIPLGDTIKFSFKTEPQKGFGTINLKCVNLPIDTAYFIQLKLDEKVIDQFFLLGDVDFSTRLVGLHPGNYELLIVEDQNQNARWDPGNYLQGILPEKIIRRPIDQLRANWEVDFTLDFTNPESPQRRTEDQ